MPFLVGPVAAFITIVLLNKLHNGVLKMHNVNLKYSYIGVSSGGNKRRQFLQILLYGLSFALWLFLGFFFVYVLSGFVLGFFFIVCFLFGLFVLHFCLLFISPLFLSSSSVS